jgi:hypothetical protein
MTDLTAWLLDRISEDEACSACRHPIAEHVGRWCRVPTGALTADGQKRICCCEAADSTARVLAQCAALRAVVELHAPQVETVEWFDAPKIGRAEVCPSCHPAEPTEWNPPVGQAGIRPEGFIASYVLAPCPTLRALASIWADHPNVRRGVGMSLDIEGVLSAHGFSAQAYYQRTDQWTAHCLADEWRARGDMGGRDAAEDAHRAHVAAVLRDQIEGALAEAWDEGAARTRAHEDALSGWLTDHCGPPPIEPTNPYRYAHLSDTERAGVRDECP